jgi:hypothetical protein
MSKNSYKKLKIIGDWSNDLKNYNPNFKRDFLEKAYADPTSSVWNNLEPTNRVHGAHDVLRNTRGWVDPETMPTFEKIRKMTGFDNCQLVILKFEKYETHLIHRDKLPKYDLIERPGVNLELNDWENLDHERLLLMLNDREPGQFMQMGDVMLNDWKAGDTFYYNGKEEPHSAGNCGTGTRWVLRITGKPTEKSRQFVEQNIHYV